MKSKVFSIDIHNHPDSQQVGIYRTNGTDHGGGLRFYNLTVSRLIRLLRAMVSVSGRSECHTWEHGDITTWWIMGVVEQMYAAQAAISAA